MFLVRDEYGSFRGGLEQLDRTIPAVKRAGSFLGRCILGGCSTETFGLGSTETFGLGSTETFGLGNPQWCHSRLFILLLLSHKKPGEI